MQVSLSTVRKKIFTHFPWGMFLLLCLWIGIGLVNLYSATRSEAMLQPLFRSQAIWFCLGMTALFFITLFDYHFLFRWAYVLYALSLVLLSLVFVKGIGRSHASQNNWISLGGFSMQPSEFAKLALILALGKYYSSHRPSGAYYTVKDLLLPFLLFLFPTILVQLQKDSGSCLFFIALFVTLTLFLKVRLRLLVIALLLAGLGGFLFYQYGLKGPQKQRIKDRVLVFMYPELDPKGKGYQLLQSKIAVGSGGLMGQGYLKGTLNQSKFVPEHHTDFIFPVFAEEWGFLGCLVLLLVMFLFLLLGLDAASKTKDQFASFVALGVVALFFWHIVINLAGVLGLMPLTGVPLPLFSYGGSSILTMMIGVGLIFNVRMRRFMF